MYDNVYSLGSFRDGDQSGRVVKAAALARALEELDEDHRHVLCAQWGIGREACSDEEVADELSVDVQRIWHLQDEALACLGFFWLTSTTLGVLSPLLDGVELGDYLGEAA